MPKLNTNDIKISHSAQIKNYEKYNSNIKLAKGLMLEFAKCRRRVGESGVSTCQFGSYWFLVPKGEVLFKSQAVSKASKTEFLNEILCYRLAKNMGVECAIYEPAIMDDMNNTNGVASYNFLKKDEQLFSLYKFLLVGALESPETRSLDIIDKKNRNVNMILELIEQSGVKYNLDMEQITKGLYQMVAFDLLTFQGDRHFNNISLIIDKRGNVTLAPLYDNEYSFMNFDKKYYSPETNNIREFIDSIFYGDEQISLSRMQYCKGLESYKEICMQLAKATVKYPIFKPILEKIINNADMRPVLCDLDKEGYLINDEYKNFLIQLLDFGREELSKAYDICKNRQDNKTKKNKEKSLNAPCEK